jgi:uncharacterized protein YihD (DUF1040 family)
VRDPKRIEPILRLLGEIWMQHPDLRLGQLLVCAIRPSDPVPEVFYAEDDKLLDGLRAYAELTRRADDGAPG